MDKEMKLRVVSAVEKWHNDPTKQELYRLQRENWWLRRLLSNLGVKITNETT